MQINGVFTADRAEWRDALHSWCVERYGDEGNTAEVQEARMVAWELEADAELERLRAAGCPASLPVELVLEALGEATAGTGGGLDHGVIEMWRGLAWESKLLVCCYFELYLLSSGEIVRPLSWMVLAMFGIKKEDVVRTVTDLRYIALSAVLGK